MALKSLCPELFYEVDRKTFKVSECFDRNRWRWRKILRGVVPRDQMGRERVLKLKELVGGIRPGNKDDGVVGYDNMDLNRGKTPRGG